MGNKVLFYQLPTILDETEDFAVVFKPPRMHCAPLQGRPSDTLLDWYAAIFPSIMKLSGRKDGEGGLLHRLDYETQGLVLFAKNQQSFSHLLVQQEEGNFIKGYSAICQKANPIDASGSTPHSSFPPPPFTISSVKDGFAIESYFRPFGPGRKQVRPVVLDKNSQVYRTEIVAFSQPAPDHYAFTVRLRCGFRHQVRCHLAWIGCPVLNDPLYGTNPDNGFLALRANGLVFVDPQSGESREYRIAPLEFP
ncbi:MAG: RNA pseudouridine synthase [Treponema sp.]|jgi:23S rRNA pseudouridine1911/1915/1917 synthase|nr:RNA pseudouridine synthase [Treponema sp.]